MEQIKLVLRVYGNKNRFTCKRKTRKFPYFPPREPHLLIRLTLDPRQNDERTLEGVQKRPL